MRHDDLPGVSHRYLDARGLRMHIAEAGSGPLALLLPDEVSKAMIGFIRELD
jgi:hypothetical protein